jgi:nucleotide-binding universal stress UspA family protein
MAGIKALIALDGTELSESALCVLPFLESLGVGQARLVSVWDDIEVPLNGWDKELEEAKARGQAFLEAYLHEKTRVWRSPGLLLEHSVKVGPAAVELLEEAEQQQPDVLVIATHGRTGVERWRLGSVAEKVIRNVDCPALVIGPNVTTPLNPYNVERIVVPLDGSPLAEEALPVACAISQKVKAELELIEVVHLPATWSADPMFQPNPVEVLGWLEEGAKEYLARQLPGDANVKRTVIRSMATGGVSYDMSGYLQDEPAQLVVMTSHGRHGFTRTVLGSVADAMLRGPSPVLLVKPGSQKLAGQIAGG